MVNCGKREKTVKGRVVDMTEAGPGAHCRHFINRRDFLKHSALGLTASLLTWGGFAPGSAAGRDVYDVVIVGGGVSGLTAAWLMRDANILLLEKEALPGGRVISRRWGRFHYAMGAAYLGSPDREMRSFFDELGLRAIPVPPPVDALANRGVIYPEDYFGSALGSPDALRDYIRVGRKMFRLNEKGIGKAVYGTDIEGLAKFEDLDRISVKQWLDRGGIGPMVQRYIDVENRGLFGANNGDISLLFDIPEMAFNLYEEGLDVADFSAGPVPDFHTYHPRADGEDPVLWTFPKGMIEMVWALEGKLKGKIRTRAQAIKVVVNPDRTVSITYRRDGRRETVRAHAAVLAAPAPVTASIVKSGFSDRVMEALKDVTYTSYITMALFLSERLFKNAWNIACLDTAFTTLNDAVRTQVGPDYNGKSILGVAIPPESAEDRSLIQMSDRTLMERALQDIERYFPGTGKKVVGKDIQRFQHAFPVFGPGYGEILWELHRDKTTRGPLFLAGDYMVYPTLGGAGASAYRAYGLISRYAERL